VLKELTFQPKQVRYKMSRPQSSKTNASGQSASMRKIAMVVIGDTGVGKSCLLLQFVDRRFRCVVDCFEGGFVMPFSRCHGDPAILLHCVNQCVLTLVLLSLVINVSRVLRMMFN
jgi:GTPase SAR1 family protein